MSLHVDCALQHHDDDDDDDDDVMYLIESSKPLSLYVPILFHKERSI